MLEMLKKTLKKLKGKGAARMFAAALISALLLESSLGISFASEGTDGSVSTGSEQEPSEEGGQDVSAQPENAQTVSGQPENEQTVSAQPGNNQTVSSQLGEGMTDAVNDFLAAMDRLLELAGNDASAEEMLAAIENARGLYENLTEEEKAIPAVVWMKEALDSFDGVMLLEDEEMTDEEAEQALRDAVNNAPENGTVTLDRDITLSSTLEINRETDITLDLKGYTLRLAGENGSVIKATLMKQNGTFATFTLTDSSAGKNGRITGGKGTYEGYIGDSHGCSFFGLMGGGVYCYGNFTMTDVVISGNTADWGGGVFCGGTFTMDGGAISENWANQGGGGVACCVKMTMTDGTISRNRAGNGGGGVYCEGRHMPLGFYGFEMTGGEIRENSPSGVTGTFIIMEGGEISGNLGGVQGSQIIMEGGRINNNWGCGVYAFSFTMGSGEIYGNLGGGVSCMDNFNMWGGRISYNSGGVHCVGHFNMRGGSINCNGMSPDIMVEAYRTNTVWISSTSLTYMWEQVDGRNIDGWYYDGGFNYNNPGSIPAMDRWSADNAQIFNKLDTSVELTQGKPLALRAAWHEHSYTNTATCTEDGEEICSCGDARPSSALGHSYNTGVVTKEAECETAGVKKITCTRCGDIKAEEEIRPIGHRWNDGTVTKPPTQTDEGVRTYTCLNDATHTKTEKINKLGGNETVTPPAHEHSYTQSKAPTCTADGKEKCSCGLTKTLPALGHSYNAGVITKEADCETAGVKTTTCSRCNDSKTETVPALGHTYTEGTVTTAAECEVPGVRTMTCSKCNKTRTEALPVTGHRWDNGIITQAPTQTEDGVRTYTCLNNETHKRTETVAKLGDNGGQTNTTGTTNTTNPGNTQQTQTAQAAETAPAQTAEPIPDAGYEYPAYRNETPDANDPETPEIIVVIGENGTPLTYKKIEDPDNPGKMIYVEDSSIPLSASPITENAGHWALLNLIMTLVSVLGGVYGLIGYVAERNRKEAKRRRWYLLGAVMAMLSVIVFVLTQDMRMAMIFADRYTFLMVALALMQTPGFLQRRKEEEMA